MSKSRRNLLIATMFVMLAVISVIVAVLHKQNNPDVSDDEQSTEETHYTQEQVETQESTEVDNFRINWGKAPDFIKVSEGVFSWEELAKATVQADSTIVTNSYATVKYTKVPIKYHEITGQLLTDIRMDYTSSAGSVSGIMLDVTEDANGSIQYRLDVYELDINKDGSKELVVRYNSVSEPGMCIIYNMYIYDFHSKEGKYIIGFEESQEKVILETMKNWFKNGFIELLEYNGMTFDTLDHDYFFIDMVECEGNVGYKVTFYDNGLKKYDAGYFNALITYEDGDFVVSDVWYVYGVYIG